MPEEGSISIYCTAQQFPVAQDEQKTLNEKSPSLKRRSNV